MNQTEKITEAPKDCSDSGSIWETGKSLFQYDLLHLILWEIRNSFFFTNFSGGNRSSISLILCYCIFRYIRKQVLPQGSTGRVAFDDNGDRIFAEYDIVNIQYTGPDNNKTQVSVGQYFYPAVSRQFNEQRGESSRSYKISRTCALSYRTIILNVVFLYCWVEWYQNEVTSERVHTQNIEKLWHNEPFLT